MGDLDLLLFGCGVSFVVGAGFYVYLRECFTRAEPAKVSRPRELPKRKKLREVACSTQGVRAMRTTAIRSRRTASWVASRSDPRS